MKRGKDVMFAFHWADEEGRPNLGEGISRTSDPGTKLWQVDVTFPGNRVMKTTIRAKTNTQALKFSKNRYPTATNFTLHGQSTL